jgi:hypothetical protein
MLTENFRNEATPAAIIAIVREARKEVIGMNTSGKRKEIKARIGMLSNSIVRGGQLKSN